MTPRPEDLTEEDLLAAGGGEPSQAFDAPAPDWASPADVSADPAQPETGPLLSIPEEPHVPHELRVHRLYDPRPEIRAARAEDRKRQDQADLSEMLLAATTRRAPNLRNLGAPELQAVLEAQKAMPRPVDEEMRRAQLAHLLGKPDVPKINALGDAFKQQQISESKSREAMYGRANQPKPEKDEPILSDEEASVMEGQLGLAPGSLKGVRVSVAKGLRPKAVPRPARAPGSSSARRRTCSRAGRARSPGHLHRHRRLPHQ
jgi:hypothetical protein